MKQTQATAICPVTGISITLADIPALPLTLEYSSPLSHYRNAIALASLSHKEFLSLKNEITAAVILTLLRATSLDGDHLPAVQKNKILAGIFAETAATAVTDLVHEFRRIVESRSDKKWLSENLPHFAFSQETNLESLQQYCEDCRSALYPAKEGTLVTKDILADLLEEERKEQARIKKEEQARERKEFLEGRPASFTTEQKTRIKQLAAELLNAGVISKKAASVFTHIATASNASLMSAEQKAQYVQYLSDKEDDAADSLAIIIASIKITPKNDVTNLLAEGNESVSERKPKQTLAEMLAAAKARKEGKQT